MKVTISTQGTEIGTVTLNQNWDFWLGVGCPETLSALGTGVSLCFFPPPHHSCQIRWHGRCLITLGPHNGFLCSHKGFLSRISRKKNMQRGAPQNGWLFFFLICIARFNFHPLNMTNCRDFLQLMLLTAPNKLH